MKISSRLITLGKVAGAHGIRGVLKVWCAGGPPEDPGFYPALGEVILGGRAYQVRDAACTRKHLLLTVAEICTREQAEALAGLEVKAEARRFPPLPPGEYYWFQLVGLTVRRVRSGEILGTLEEILATPAHDVYVVHRDKGELLLPAVEDVILKIDTDLGVMEVEPPAGLLDLYAD